MPYSKASPGGGANKAVKRNLPSWMSSRDSDRKCEGNDPNDDGEDEKHKQAKGRGKVHAKRPSSKETKTSEVSAGTTSFSKLLDGVVFVLSGFVNPERSILRSQAMEMGAVYQPDWNSDCTLLVCAFPNTPKFRQVQADCGSIVSKEWISECYAQKKLVDIETYLLHAGKPWRKGNISYGSTEDQQVTPPKRNEKKAESRSHSKAITSASSKLQNGDPNPLKDLFPRDELKKWALDDLNRTICWLENQKQKPEPSEIKNIAAGGILTCIQDVIDSLEEKQNVCKISEQWSIIPRVVEKLAKLENSGNGLALISHEDLCKEAKACKQIYETELSCIGDDSIGEQKKPKIDRDKYGNRKTKATPIDGAGYDSDETIEMTEEEIDHAYKSVVSKICK